MGPRRAVAARETAERYRGGGLRVYRQGSDRWSSVASRKRSPGCSSEDPAFKRWVAEHRAQNGGNPRMSKGATGVRVMFSEKADMTFWKERSEAKAKDRKPHAA